VPPDTVEVRLNQLAQATQNTTEALEAFRRVGLDTLMTRGNLHAFTNAAQAETIFDKHYREWTSQTLAQWVQRLPGTLRRRKMTLEDSDKTLDQSLCSCAVCFESFDFDKGYWLTLCGHRFCADCGPMAFRNWVSNHNAAQVFIDCPACRTPLCSFDTLRIRQNVED
jgi:hypothetical protein